MSGVTPGPPRYILFAGQHYYPSGGADDIIGSYSSLSYAKKIGRKLVKGRSYSRACDWWHVYDIQNRTSVAGEEK